MHWKAETSLIICLTAAFCVFNDLVSANYLVKPSNTVAMMGQAVRLNCSTQPFVILWMTLQPPDNGVDVASGTTSYDTTLYAVYTDGVSSSELELIPQPGTSRAGPYGCYYCYGCTSGANVAFAEFVELDDTTACVPDFSSNKLRCGGSFYHFEYSSDLAAPSAAWFSCGDVSGTQANYQRGTNYQLNTLALPTTDFDITPTNSPTEVRCNVRIQFDVSICSTYCAANDAVYNFPTLEVPAVTIGKRSGNSRQHSKRRCGRVDTKTTCVCRKIKKGEPKRCKHAYKP